MVDPTGGILTAFGAITESKSENCPKDVVRVLGFYGSPYTQKMLSVMRFYRRSYRFIIQANATGELASRPGLPQLAPTFFFGTEPMVDSTKIIERLEAEGASGRSLIPPNPALAFLARLVEDFGDEWCTKMMYHFRWDEEAEQKKASLFLVYSMDPAAPPQAAQNLAEFLRNRQVKRLEVVGSNSVTKPTIEQDFLRLTDLLDQHLASGSPFLFGRRPSVADFALFGQLVQLWQVENRSRMQLEQRSLRVAGWLAFMADLSGWPVSEEDWHTALSPTAAEIVHELGRHYAPFMVANAASLAQKAKLVEVKMPDGTPWSQPSCSYQGKCLMWLREDYARLGSGARTVVDSVLKGSGLEMLFSQPDKQYAKL